jgi:uncharacterized membrane protein YeaQ/YmgE (transglycosylase-associated protein family)
VGLLAWIVVGLIAGSLAQSVTGVEKRGCLFTLLIGVLGGVIGGMLFNAAGSRGITEFGWWSLFVAFVGAGALCLVLRVASRRPVGRR